METTLFYIAVPVTVLYLAQIVMAFMGVDGYNPDIDIDPELGDGDSETFQFFTLKNAVGFFMGLSWGGIIGLRDLFWNEAASFMLGIILGILIVLLQSSIFYFMSKLQSKNIPSLEEAIGQTATVYLKIPEVLYGKGKVAVVINGSTRILDAFSVAEEIPTGGQCRVVRVINDNLYVEPID